MRFVPTQARMTNWTGPSVAQHRPYRPRRELGLDLVDLGDDVRRFQVLACRVMGSQCLVPWVSMLLQGHPRFGRGIIQGREWSTAGEPTRPS